VPLYKASFSTLQRTQCASNRKTIQLMLSREENLIIVRIIFMLTKCTEFSVDGNILLPLGLKGLNEL
jgi:HKD family nuclease